MVIGTVQRCMELAGGGVKGKGRPGSGLNLSGVRWVGVEEEVWKDSAARESWKKMVECGMGGLKPDVKVSRVETRRTRVRNKLPVLMRLCFEPCSTLSLCHGKRRRTSASTSTRSCLRPSRRHSTSPASPTWPSSGRRQSSTSVRLPLSVVLLPCLLLADITRSSYADISTTTPLESLLPIHQAVLLRTPTLIFCSTPTSVRCLSSALATHRAESHTISQSDVSPGT